MRASWGCIVLTSVSGTAAVVHMRMGGPVPLKVHKQFIKAGMLWLVSQHTVLRFLQIGSTILAQAAGVPTLAWSGSGVAVSFEECHGDIPTDIYNKVSSAKGFSCIATVNQALLLASCITYLFAGSS
jgi:hypothetical protein